MLPAGSRIATSRINFRLLAREARERSRRLAIVAPEASTRALAASAGCPSSRPSSSTGRHAGGRMRSPRGGPGFPSPAARQRRPGDAASGAGRSRLDDGRRRRLAAGSRRPGRAARRGPRRRVARAGDPPPGRPRPRPRPLRPASPRDDARPRAWWERRRGSPRAGRSPRPAAPVAARRGGPAGRRAPCRHGRGAGLRPASDRDGHVALGRRARRPVSSSARRSRRRDRGCRDHHDPGRRVPVPLSASGTFPATGKRVESSAATARSGGRTATQPGRTRSPGHDRPDRHRRRIPDDGRIFVPVAILSGPAQAREVPVPERRRRAVRPGPAGNVDPGAIPSSPATTTRGRPASRTRGQRAAASARSSRRSTRRT